VLNYIIISPHAANPKQGERTLYLIIVRVIKYARRAKNWTRATIYILFAAVMCLVAVFLLLNRKPGPFSAALFPLSRLIKKLSLPRRPLKKITDLLYGAY
jgi:hypothetical protein